VKKATKATYVEHADGWTVRPTINGKRYFIGYWPTAEDAIRAANAVKRDAVGGEESAKQAAQLARDLAKVKRDERRADKPDAPPQRVPMAQRLTQLEQRMQQAELLIRELMQGAQS
jgi:hypothetical protein